MIKRIFLFLLLTALSACSVSPIFLSREVPVSTITPSPEFRWAIYFEYEFDEDYWKLGENSYRIVVDCPETSFLKDLDSSVNFTIDKNFKLWPIDAVILLFHDRFILEWDGWDIMPFTFNPQQRSKMIVWYPNLNHEQVIQAQAECKVYAIINGELELNLIPRIDPKLNLP